MLSISLPRSLTSGLLGVLMLLATSVFAFAQNSPTEDVKDCLSNAYDKNYQCQTDGKWWNDLLCALKFEADVVLCVLPVVPR